VSLRLGLLSDTHGLLRPEVFDALAGVDHVLHAGDVGPAELLTELEAIAPVTAVSGNTDGWEVAHRVPEEARLELGGATVVLVHGHRLPSRAPAALAAAYPDADLVVFGHTHEPLIERFGRTLVVNPGSAGRRRFRLPVTVARARVEAGRVEAEIVDLLPGAAPPH
jgi:putative phosphoesterase